MKRAIALFAAAFCGLVFAFSVPTDHRMIWWLQWANTASLAWIGFYCIYNALRKRARV
jgi:hypothetical protein